MASRIEFATIGQVDMSKYSKNQVFSAQTAGLDLGANMPEGGEKPFTNVTVTTMSANNGIDTITTVEKEED